MDKNMAFALCFIALAGFAHAAEDGEWHGNYTSGHESVSEGTQQHSESSYGKEGEGSNATSGNGSFGAGNGTGEREETGNYSAGNREGNESGNESGGIRSDWAGGDGDEGAVSNATMSGCGFGENYTEAVSQELGRTDAGFRQSVMGLMSNGSAEDREEFCDSLRRHVDRGNASAGQGERAVIGSANAGLGNATERMDANLVIRRRVEPAAVMGMLMRGMGAMQIVQALAHERLSASGTLRMGNETFMLVNGWVNGTSLRADLYSAANGSMVRAGDAELEVAGDSVSGLARVRGTDIEVRRS